MSGGEESGAERSHEPTPRRLAKAREEGDLPHAQDAQTFVVYLGFAGAVLLGGGWTAERVGRVLMAFLDRPSEFAPLFIGPAAGEAGLALGAALALPLAPVLLAPGLAVLALLAAQRGLVLAPMRLRPRLSRISPRQNARNRFGPRGMVEFAKSATKLAAVAAVLALVLAGEQARLGRYTALDARFTGWLLEHELRSVLGGLLGVAAALGGFDLVWQWFSHRRRLRMTREELREEQKHTEGDPQLRAERRDRARQLAGNRMLLAVPEADVVITNPSHYAVALQWARNRHSAPRCVAKGVDEIALAIRARAAAAGVPVRTDPPTARSLHALVAVGEEIRPEHYRAVAAAIVFAEEMRRKARGQHR